MAVERPNPPPPACHPQIRLHARETYISHPADTGTAGTHHTDQDIPLPVAVLSSTVGA